MSHPHAGGRWYRDPINGQLTDQPPERRAEDAPVAVPEQPLEPQPLAAPKPRRK